MLHLNDIKYGHFNGELLDLSNLIGKIKQIAESIQGKQGKLVDYSAPRVANSPDSIKFNDLLGRLAGKRIFIDIAEEDSQELQNLQTPLMLNEKPDLHLLKYEGKPSDMLHQLEQELKECDATILFYDKAPIAWLEERIVRCKFNHMLAQMRGKPKSEEWVYIVINNKNLNSLNELLEDLPKYIRLVERK